MPFRSNLSGRAFVFGRSVPNSEFLCNYKLKYNPRPGVDGGGNQLLKYLLPLDILAAPPCYTIGRNFENVR